jgi:hypothetical protein
VSYDEGQTVWSRAWVLLFAAVSALLLLAIPFLTFKQWSIAAALGFGLLESVGLLRHRDRLPPLTFIVRRYVPEWLTFVIAGFFVGVAGGYWFDFAHPFRLGGLLALYSWVVEHFVVTYEEGGS